MEKNESLHLSGELEMMGHFKRAEAIRDLYKSALREERRRMRKVVIAWGLEKKMDRRELDLLLEQMEKAE